MSDADEKRKILQMSEGELLDYVIDYPHTMTDSYYSKLRDAVYKRYDEIRKSTPALTSGDRK